MTMTTTSFQVSGMTCGHCVQSVTDEVGRLDGVIDVTVELASGTVTVTSESGIDVAGVRAAVDEAGYEVLS